MIRMSWLRILLASLVLLVAAPAVRLAAAPSPSGEQEALIRAVLDSQIAAWNRGDIPGFMDGYWKSDEVVFIGSGGIVRGWKSVLQRYKAAFPTERAMGQLAFTSVDVTLTCPDDAYVIGEYRLQRANDALTGVFTLQVHKFLAGWRITVDHTTAYPANNPSNQ